MNDRGSDSDFLLLGWELTNKQGKKARMTHAVLG